MGNYLRILGGVNIEFVNSVSIDNEKSPPHAFVFGVNKEIR